MDFSVIIPSRNRPSLLRKAIESVLAQDHDSFEVLVINDGSDGDSEIEYKNIAKEYGPKIKVFNLEKTESGHGPSYVINVGSTLAKGNYITFLDDDDFWTDSDHLSRCNHLTKNSEFVIDAIYCNQKAIKSNGMEVSPVWLDGLLKVPGVEAHPVDSSIPSYFVTADHLMQHAGFAHLNTSIIRRTLYLKIGGMDNSIIYEGDRDLFLRTVDSAKTIIHIPLEVSQHNIPDPHRKDNVSTLTNDLQKHLSQLYLLDKAQIFSNTRSVREYGRRYKAVTLKRISQLLAQNQRLREATVYATEALGTDFSLKWAAYAGWLRVKAAFS